MNHEALNTGPSLLREGGTAQAGPRPKVTVTAAKKESERRKPGTDTRDGWRRNDGKDEREKLGTARRDKTVFMLARAEEPPEGCQSVRSSDEAGNDRGAKGRRKVETR